MSSRTRWKNLGLSFPVFIGLAVASCNTTEEIGSIQADFYPAAQGMRLEYRVDSIHYNAFESRIDTFMVYEQRIFEKTMESGREEFNIRVSYRSDTTSNWEFNHYEKIRKTATMLEQVIANVRYIRLVFPVEVGKIWDGNAGNSSSRVMFRYKEIGGRVVNSNRIFSSCLLVDEGRDSLLTGMSGGFAWYAEGLGLIKYEHRDIDLTGNAADGYKLTKELTDWQF